MNFLIQTTFMNINSTLLKTKLVTIILTTYKEPCFKCSSFLWREQFFVYKDLKKANKNNKKVIMTINRLKYFEFYDI